jgi:hypothetical protein
VDFNNDGKKDLIVGDSDGFIHVFLNVGTDAKPVLGRGQRLQVGGKVFSCSSRAKPWAVDWNNDGKMDLVVGTEEGTVLLLLNTGTARVPAFKEAVPLLSGRTQLNGGMRVCPAVFDWNHDGKKDLLCADEFGEVKLFENKGTDAQPVFAGAQVIQARGSPIYAKGTPAKAASGAVQPAGKDFSPICGGYRSRVTVVDWNNDGKPDLLYGVTSYSDNKGYLYLFLAE